MPLEGVAANLLAVAMHEGQLNVTVDVVRRVLRDQISDWAMLPIVPVPAEGTVNAIFRIGDELAARFPLQPCDVETARRSLRLEVDAAVELSAHTSFPVPEPVAIGEPGAGFPLPWSVQTWLPGITASQQDTSSSDGFAHDLAKFIAEVRSIDVGARSFAGEGRGGDLHSHDEWMEVCFKESEHLFDVARLGGIWARLRELPRESPDVMTHGDLTPGNVLVNNGRLVGILDVGGLGPSDPALDLVAGWHMLDTGRRRLFRAALSIDELEWERGKAWAFEQAMGAAWYYRSSNPVMSQMGRRTIERILADESVA